MAYLTQTKPVAEYTHVAKVTSSNIDVLYYDDHTKNLYVVFNSGNVAGYAGVPYTEYMQLKNAVSVGRFYNSFIKGQYKGLNGDVTFRARTPVATAPKAQYQVELSVSYTKTVTVNADGFDDAAKRALTGIDGTSKVLSIKQV